MANWLLFGSSSPQKEFADVEVKKIEARDAGSTYLASRAIDS